jgi:hypothetical protein
VEEMGIEERIISDWLEARSTRELKLLAVRLIEERFDAGRMARLAARERGANRLGYLADTGAGAAELSGRAEAARRLQRLASELTSGGYRWTHLNRYTPAFGRKIIRSGPQRALNIRWKVWSTLEESDVADWLVLYSSVEDHDQRQMAHQGRRSVHSSEDGSRA